MASRSLALPKFVLYPTLLTLLALPIHLKIQSSFKNYTNFLSYIWTGDHLDEYERKAEDALTSSTKKLLVLEEKLLEIEADIEICKLDTIEDMEPVYPPTLVQRLGGVSILLDKVAAQVDGVETKDTERRMKRKRLSKEIVVEFERCDSLRKVVQC